MNNVSRPEPSFIRQQHEFAARIRDPAGCPCPADVEPRRMAIYETLFFNNVQSFLADAFPVLRGISDDRYWLDMVRDFYARHASVTPHFTRLAEEFLRYLEFERGKQTGDPPFLLELAHYEWVELALAYHDATVETLFVDPAGDLLDGCPQVSPLAWSLSYRFAVHRIGPDYQPDAPADEPVYLMVYRARDDNVGFLEVNALTHALLAALRTAPDATGRMALQAIAEVMGEAASDVVMQNGLRLLEELRQRDIIIGTLKPV
jgi:hypothetical protein